MNKTVNCGLSILQIINLLIHEFWYEYVQLKVGEKAILCYTNTDSFIVCIKTEDIFVDIEKEVEKRFDNSHYNLDRPLP